MRQRALWRVLPYLRPHRGRIVLIVLAAVVSMVCQVSIPFIAAEVIDGPVADGDRAGVWPWFWLSVALASVELLFNVYRRSRLSGVATSIETDLRNDLYAHLQRLDVGFHDDWQSGQLLSPGHDRPLVAPALRRLRRRLLRDHRDPVVGHHRDAGPPLRPSWPWWWWRAWRRWWRCAACSCASTTTSSAASRTRPATSPPSSRRAPRASASSRRSAAPSSCSDLFASRARLHPRLPMDRVRHAHPLRVGAEHHPQPRARRHPARRRPRVGSGR